MSDIVERLRELAAYATTFSDDKKEDRYEWEAADEIERLRSLIEAQRVDIQLLIKSVCAGDPNEEIRIRVEDMERRLWKL